MWSVPSLFTTGQVLTSANMNAILYDLNILYGSSSLGAGSPFTSNAVTTFGNSNISSGGSATNPVRWKVYGGIVYLNGLVHVSSGLTNGTWGTIFTLPPAVTGPPAFPTSIPYYNAQTAAFIPTTGVQVPMQILGVAAGSSVGAVQIQGTGAGYYASIDNIAIPLSQN